MISDPQSEKCLLALLVTEPNSFYEISTLQITGDDFTDEINQKIFRLIEFKVDKGEKFDRSIIADEISKMVKVESEEILSRFRGYISKAYLEVYAKKIKDSSKLRSLMSICENTKELISSGNAMPEDMAQEMISKIDSVGTIANGLKVFNQSDLAKEIIQTLNQTKKPGIDLGFKDLDYLTNGIQQSSLNIIAARPAMGKTTFALACAKNLSHKKRVLYLSYELDQRQIAAKIVCSMALVDTRKFFNPDYVQKDDRFRRISKQAMNMAKNMNINVVTKKLTLPELRHLILKLTSEKAGLGAIFIDNINNMPWPKGAKGLYEAITVITGKLKEFALEFGTPIFGLAQLNRESVKGSERPKLHHLRDSGSIEQDADMVMLLHRDDYDPDCPVPTGVLDIIIPKNRFAGIGICKLKIDLATGTVEDMTNERRPY